MCVQITICIEFLYRRNTDEFCEMCCQLPLTHEMLKDSIPYKYAVVTSRFQTQPGVSWEFIPIGKGDPNRVLTLSPKQQHKAISESTCNA